MTEFSNITLKELEAIAKSLRERGIRDEECAIAHAVFPNTIVENFVRCRYTNNGFLIWDPEGKRGQDPTDSDLTPS